MIAYCDWGGSYFRYRYGELEGRLCSHDLDLFGWIDSLPTPPSALHIAYAGQVRDNTPLSAPNITSNYPDLAHALASRYGITLRCDNDMKCAALAESALYPNESIALLYAGTGLGSAIMEGRHLLRGAYNLAGEIGHIPYHEAPYRCGCGGHNCLELHSSGGALSKRLQHEGLDTDLSLEYLYHHHPHIAHEWIDALTHAAATLITLTNPQRLILGGGMIDGWLFAILQESILAHTFAPAREGLRITHSTLSDPPLEGTYYL